MFFLMGKLWGTMGGVDGKSFYGELGGIFDGNHDQ